MMNMMMVAALLAGVMPAIATETAGKQKALPVPGENFTVGDDPAFVILPPPDKVRADSPIPWVWYAPTFPNLPEQRERWMIERFQAAGIAVAGIDVGVSHGSPKGRAGFSAFYKHMVEKRGFSRKPALVARSQGGLMHYNWAAENPEAVGCIAGIYPVGDLRSWPGLKAAAGPYEMTVGQLEAQLAAHNPVDSLAPLAKAGIPLFHIHGDVDKLVPLDANSGTIASRYKELGGPMTLKIAGGQGHNYWSGFFECQELVDFVIACIAPLSAAPKDKRTQNPAIVFMVAGQSNAGGCGVYSPEMHKELGRDEKRPLVPGTTASEIGLPTDAAAYTHSYIWMPKTGFGRLDPMVNTRPDEPGQKMHGMELPMVHRLEERFPDNDIYIIKHGPSGRSLHTDWNPAREGGHYSKFLDGTRKGLAQLAKEYPEVRVIGLYWDQGESDGSHADAYAENLANFIAKFRQDSGLPDLKVFIRKHIYRGGAMDRIIAAQEAVAAKDENSFLLDIELETLEKNYATWSYSPNNVHINSKAFVELARILMEEVLKNPELASFGLYAAPPPQGGNPGYQFTPEGGGNQVELGMNDNALELKIQCPKGMGKGRLARPDGVQEWPEKIVLLLRYEEGKPLPRVEGFGLKAGQKIIQSMGGNQDVISQNAHEKTDAGLEIVIPGNILAGESEVLIEWIDFFRR